MTKVEGTKVLVTELCLTLCDSMNPHQSPLSMGFFRQEYWSGLPFPSPGDLPNPGIEPGCLWLTDYKSEVSTILFFGLINLLVGLMKLKKNILLTRLLVYYIKDACMHAKLLQSCLTVCDPMDCSPQVPLSMGILQPRILEWVAMPSSRGFPTPGIELHLYVSCISSSFFTIHTTWEAPVYYKRM